MRWLVDSLTSKLVKLLPSAGLTGVTKRSTGITDGSSKRPRNPCGLKPQAITNAPNGFLDIDHRIGGSKKLFLAIWPFRNKDLWRFSHAVAVDISCCPISVVLFRPMVIKTWPPLATEYQFREGQHNDEAMSKRWWRNQSKIRQRKPLINAENILQKRSSDAAKKRSYAVKTN